MSISGNNGDNEDDSSEATDVVSGSSSTDSGSDSDNEMMDDGQHLHDHDGKNSQLMGRDVTQPSESDSALQEKLSSATTKQKEMAEKLSEMQGVNDALKTEIAETKGSHAKLLNHVNKLLERLDEKDTVLSNITMEKNELVEKVAKATGLNNRIESDIQEARAGLLPATSAAAVAESTVASLRSTIEELRSENESTQEQVNERRNTIPVKHLLDAVPIPSTSSTHIPNGGSGCKMRSSSLLGRAGLSSNHQGSHSLGSNFHAFQSMMIAQMSKRRPKLEYDADGQYMAQECCSDTQPPRTFRRVCWMRFLPRSNGRMHIGHRRVQIKRQE
mmetsp:Transcript_38642/g.70857  ORF Transcript_38642/g.70857 Transcript_38642/m.70857 type:complete len:330 (-) Transcript_38642:400-1389(-)